MKRHFEFVIAYLFKFVSFLFMLYLTSLQLNRFFSNKDVSTVTIKKFLTSDDKNNYYPTFSVCLEEDHYGQLFNDTYLQEEGLTSDESMKFQDMLKGKEVNETILSLTKSDRMMKDLHHIICYVFAKSRTGDEIDNWIKERSCSNQDWSLTGNGGEVMPFYISYRTPDKMCFTPTSSNERHKRKEDILKLDLQWMISPSEGSLSSASLKIYAHGKGQLIRNFGKEIHNVKLFDLYPYPIEKIIKNKIELSFSYISVIKKRADSNIPCYAGKLDDDFYIRKWIVDEIGCIPPYWSDLPTHSMGSSICYTAKQLEDAYEFITNIEETLNRFDESCTEMTIVSSIQFGSATLDNDKSRFEIKVNYLTESYQEIANKKDFSGEALWSSVGGLVGIFLGYSMMQIPDSLLAIKQKFVERKFHHKNGEGL